MGYMKEEWLRQEMERQDALLDAMDGEYAMDGEAEQRHHQELIRATRGGLLEICTLCGLMVTVHDRRTEGWNCPGCNQLNAPAPQKGKVPERGPGGETDKVEGTRDVEKFLKEQQDALWRDE